MNFLNDEMLLGDFLSPLNQSSLASESTLGLLDDYLGAAGPSPSPTFSSFKTKDVLSDWLSLESLHNMGRSDEDAFFGMDWMVEKMDLRLFDFDSLLGAGTVEDSVLAVDLMEALEDSCDLLEDLPLSKAQDSQPVAESLRDCPASPTGTDQVAPFSPTSIGNDQVAPVTLFFTPVESTSCSDFSLPLSPKIESSTPECYIFSPSQGSITTPPDHPTSLELGSEVDIAERQKLVQPFKFESEEEASSDDSGICLSPASYLVSPKHSPYFSVASPTGSALNHSLLDLSQQSPVLVEPSTTNWLDPETAISARPKPYDPPNEDKVLATVKVAGGERKLDKKTKKMEQNKTAATRYRQKKRAEQEAISAECRELEGKNEVLQEKVDSLVKEIQYLKDLMEEVRMAKSKRAKSQ